jgi:hypothetical protein
MGMYIHKGDLPSLVLTELEYAMERYRICYEGKGLSPVYDQSSAFQYQFEAARQLRRVCMLEGNMKFRHYNSRDVVDLVNLAHKMCRRGDLVKLIRCGCEDGCNNCEDSYT